MMRNTLPMTPEGHQKLSDELTRLVKVEREVIKVAINEAREHGDLKENAEYHSAKEKQAIIEGRVLELQHKLGNAQIIDIQSINSEKVVFGATVKLFDIDKDNSIQYQIVGTDEADTKKGKISYEGPLGKALIGKEVGDIVIVNAPKGDFEYEIEAIEFN